jgi:hypothetical protein
LRKRSRAGSSILAVKLGQAIHRRATDHPDRRRIMPMISEATGRSFLERPPILVDLEVVCLWSVLGLLPTMLLLALGFGAEIGQALAMAG